MKINYKIMDKTHVEGVFELSKISFAIPWTLESVNHELENNIARYIIAENDLTGEVIGFVGVWIIAGEGNITNIAVHPTFKRMGIASSLLTMLFELCSKEECKNVTLEVRESNIPAQNLYKKHGFVEEGLRKRYYQDNGENAIIMWKRNIC